MNQTTHLAQYADDYQALIANQLSLHLATTASNGQAEASYAPYLYLDGVFYLLLSQLAKHTANVLRNQQASILILQPEAEANNIFARQRVSFNCKVSCVSKDSEQYSVIQDAMQSRFGNIIDMLTSLPDFQLFALQPTQGSYIAGFGKAFSIDK